MNYASMSIDRRADYYARSAALIAADPLDFYTRAEKGRRFLASRIKNYYPEATQTSAVTVAQFNNVTALPARNLCSVAA